MAMTITYSIATSSGTYANYWGDNGTATNSTNNVYAFYVRDVPAAVMLEIDPALATILDWKAMRHREGMRRRLYDRRSLAVADPRAPLVLKFGRAPRRGPWRSRRLLGKAHPLNRSRDDAQL